MAEKVMDVVCRMMIDPDTAPAATTYHAEAYYFCGPACQVTFEDDPEQFIRMNEDLADPGTTRLHTAPTSERD